MLQQLLFNSFQKTCIFTLISMGKVVDLNLGSSGDLSEDITNPCRKSELKIMYEKLRMNEWANLVPKLKKEGSGMSSKDLRMKAKQVIKVGFHKLIHRPNSIHIKLGIMSGSMKLTIKKQSKRSLKQFPMEYVLHPIVEECYKIGCLMALHNPPLLLDFDNCGQGTFPPIKTVRIIL
uniref:Uncharacterized protein n=1 Tax=Astyanax mexicanus TaxID=7994 RepID=A0A8B9HR61_ASTMX